MMYRNLLEELARLQRETDVERVSASLGQLTKEQEQEMIEEIGIKPETNQWGNSTVHYYPEGEPFFTVTFHYSVPITKEDEIAALEEKLAKLKEGVVNA